LIVLLSKKARGALAVIYIGMILPIRFGDVARWYNPTDANYNVMMLGMIIMWNLYCTPPLFLLMNLPKAEFRD